MRKTLRDIEARALEAQRAGDFELAATLWRTLIVEAPGWENGYPHYYLADCLTRLGRVDMAEEAYRKAIEIAPEDKLFALGLQSLLDARKSGNV